MVLSIEKITKNKGKEMAKDRTKYIFNGNTYGKGRLVLAVVEQYVSDNPGLSKEKLHVSNFTGKT